MGTPSSPASPMPPSASRGLPKVPSLVFDMELEDGAHSAHSPDEMDVQLVETELRRFLRPCTPAMTALCQQVETVMSNAARCCPMDTAVALDSLRASLQRSGYNVCVRRALGGGEGSLCLHNLRHVFLTVSCPGDDQTFVVDPSFADQFKIAKSTSRYDSIVACLPHVLVAPEDKVPPLVTFLCNELASAFKASNTVVPPWRQRSSMLSKWQPRRSLDVAGSPREVAQAYGYLDAETRYAAPAERGSRFVPSKVVISAAIHIKPLALEPNRVYGGFSSFGYLNMAT